ncbi:MAG TPA: hypothetical protein VHX87_08000 [Galbitalea sp.]|jgi:predicted acyltransferase (DUF342 family)|nr:hypothetical protein [Galbitalea sp.]
MGFFGDLNKLRIQGEEMREKQDVKGDMANAKAKMDAMNAAYAAAAPKPEDPASEARRVDATATVQSASQTGMMVNMMQGVNANLLVMVNGIPMPVSTMLMVPIMNMVRLQPGAQLSVSIDPQDPNSVRIDWSK